MVTFAQTDSLRTPNLWDVEKRLQTAFEADADDVFLEGL